METWDALFGRNSGLQIRFLVCQLLVYPRGNKVVEQVLYLTSVRKRLVIQGKV